mmetsp:Transcript_13336/g.18219  ORF Transcript_13336/g.18219 Transcript_13336/m.18219 type:complete len:189 (-) Transcript_13336:166-732(-)|eukprot:CAMPEP_0196571720 /NCGR_PEP_ID=MMETSP1081-20130531/1852_1 /TAXON_ID=36882 /ORGANISM="Pyramimonas amylifera, Strain CCMP720" /LENGTH=188 /DNA_ID=CAMNT_0041888761 /DNA_START=157 /DNA_END=723 /DNA_ORIENTATION=+
MSSYYSLWAKPAIGTPVYIALEKMVSSLAEAHNTLPFAPHVTILGGIQGPKAEIVAACEELCELFSSVSYSFNKVQAGTFYFQCVFLKADEAPEVMGLHEAAKSVLAKYKDVTVSCPSPDYMPHASLMYANMSSEEKSHIVNELSGKIDDFSSFSFDISSLFFCIYEHDDYSMISWKEDSEYMLKGRN